MIKSWNLLVRCKGSIDIWKEKTKRLKMALKGWNFNEEGKMKKVRNDLKKRINELDIKNETDDLSDTEKNEKRTVNSP